MLWAALRALVQLMLIGFALGLGLGLWVNMGVGPDAEWVQAVTNVTGVIGQIFGQVIALFSGCRRLDGCRAVVQGRVPLVVLAADEAVELLEAAAG